MKRKACAFSGHRPQSLPWKNDETAPACIKLKEILTQQITQLTERGFTDFLTGMALGVDTWAAQIVLNLQKENPALKLHCILPCKEQPKDWTQEEQQRYYSILWQADAIIYTSRNYHNTCMQKRNHFLVEKSDLLLAVYNSRSPRSGTGATLHYAQKLGKEVIVINPATAEITANPK